MMTVVAIMAGLLPILWSEGAGSEVMRRIAVPMVGGMLSSTLLTLIVIPAIYVVVKRRMVRATEGVCGATINAGGRVMMQEADRTHALHHIASMMRHSAIVRWRHCPIDSSCAAQRDQIGELVLDLPQMRARSHDCAVRPPPETHQSQRTPDSDCQNGLTELPLPRRRNYCAGLTAKL